MGKRLGLVALAVLLLGVPTAGAAAGVRAEPAAEVSAEQQSPRWQRCAPDKPEKFQCANVRVPLDYANPDGKKIDIAVSRVRAADPDKRRGVLLMNPGGPGARGLDLPVSKHLPKKVTDRYDLIGFDPRGIGASTPISCGLGEGSRFPIPFDKEKFDEHVAWSKAMAEKCWANEPELLPHITTRNTARDMNVIRAALGERRISYLGASYGTYLGTVYTQLFPTRSDRIVLDSSIDPERVWRGMVQIWSLPAERGFDLFAEWAAKRDDTYGLGSTPLRVDSTFRQLLNKLDREPVMVGGQRYDGNKVRLFAHGIGQYEENNKHFAELLRKLRAADGRNLVGTLPEAPPAPPLHWQHSRQEPHGGSSGSAAEPPVDNSASVLFAVICGDARWPSDVDQYRRDAIRDSRRYPIMGGQTSNIAPCAFWPRPREPRTEIRDNQADSILLVQTSHDTQTPIEGARNLRRLLPDNSRMALVEGSWRHGAYPGDCADDTVTDYLVTGRLPARDTSCRTVRP